MIEWRRGPIAVLSASVLWVLQRLHALVSDWGLAIILFGAVIWALLLAVLWLRPHHPCGAGPRLRRKIHALERAHASDRAQLRGELLALLRSQGQLPPGLSRFTPLLSYLGTALRVWAYLGLLLVLWNREERGAPPSSGSPT